MRTLPHALALSTVFASSALAFQASQPVGAPRFQQSFEEANALAAHPRWLSLKYADFDTRGAAPSVPSDLAARVERDGARGYFLAQFDGAITEELKSAVRSTGVELLDYVPNFAFIVRATDEQRAELATLASTLWTGALHPAYRLDERLLAASNNDALAATTGRVVVTAFEGVARETLEAQLETLGLRALDANDACGRWICTVVATPHDARRIANAHDVQWVEPEGRLELRNNTMVWTVQTFVNGNTKLWTNGVNGTGQVVGHIDGNIALSSCYFSDPSGAPIGPTHRKVVYNSGTGVDSHGTHTAGTACGDAQPVNGTTTNRGLAYLAKLAHSALTGSSYTAFNAQVTTLMNNGARVYTNSWGDDGTTAYTTLCNQVDSFQWNNEDNLVFFAVSNNSLITTPDNAKNLVGVGASQNGASANSKASGFSGAGPTADGRRKPDLMTPGQGLISAGTSSCNTASMSGTSMACPNATAAGALVRQYFMGGFHPTGAAVGANAFTPTAALVKAVLVNTTQDMTGVTGYPSNAEGWGRINLDETLYFPGDTTKMIVKDVRRSAGMTTGQSTVYTFTVNASTTPLELTLAFSDAPGTVNAANPVINNLDLVVTSPASVNYLGNVFTSSWSATGGTADLKNNVERVALASPAVGVWTVTINATNVPQANQGFGLCISGDVTDGGSSASSDPTPYCTTSLTSNFCQPFMSATGDAHVGASSGFVLIANNVDGTRQGIIFYGTSGRNAAVWALGSSSILCVKSPLQRMTSINAGGTSGLCDGVIAEDWNAYLASHPFALGNPLIAGTVVDAQGWFRDPPAPGTTNLTDGLEFTVIP